MGLKQKWCRVCHSFQDATGFFTSVPHKCGNCRGAPLEVEFKPLGGEWGDLNLASAGEYAERPFITRSGDYLSLAPQREFITVLPLEPTYVFVVTTQDKCDEISDEGYIVIGVAGNLRTARRTIDNSLCLHWTSYTINGCTWMWVATTLYATYWIESWEVQK